MQKFFLFSLLVAVVVAFPVAEVADEDVEVLVFGDSWGSFGGREFERMFTKRGHDDIVVKNEAIGGTTAQFWARTPDVMVEKARKYPNLKWIWLSIGGNDGIYGLSAGRPIDDILEKGVEDTLVFLQPLLDEFPHIKVVQFGYDVVNFEGLVCEAMAKTTFKGHCDYDDVECINDLFFRIQFDYVELLGKLLGGTNYVEFSVLGSMQERGGIPAPHPNAAYYTPRSLMGDCIHPNDDGFEAIFDALWEGFFRYEIEGLEA